MCATMPGLFSQYYPSALSHFYLKLNSGNLHWAASQSCFMFILRFGPIKSLSCTNWASICDTFYIFIMSFLSLNLPDVFPSLLPSLPLSLSFVLFWDKVLVCSWPQTWYVVGVIFLPQASEWWDYMHVLLDLLAFTWPLIFLVLLFLFFLYWPLNPGSSDIAICPAILKFWDSITKLLHY